MGANRRRVDRLLLAVGAGLIVVAVARITIGFITVPLAVGLDYGIYMRRADDFLAGRGLYLPHQLQGPYHVEIGDSLYPPTLLPLFVLFTVLPAVLWWLIPLGIIGTVIAWHRPAAWAWAIIGLLALTDGVMLTIVKGNPGRVDRSGRCGRHDLASSIRACPGCNRRSRRWRSSACAAEAGGSGSPCWWACRSCSFRCGSTMHTRSPGRDVGPAYSLTELPFYLIPLVAWLGSRRAPPLALLRG